MDSVCCVYCENRVPREQPFCGRCGGRPSGESASDQAISGLILAGRLIHQRIWFGLEKEIAAVKRHLDRDKNLEQVGKPALDWLVSELSGLAFEPDIPRMIQVGKLVLGLARDRDYPEVRDQIHRLIQFTEALEGGEQEWAGRRRPSQRKALAWLTNQAEQVGMTADQAIESVFETPERWPIVAETIDPEANRQVVWKLEMARASADFQAKHYSSAWAGYEAVLAQVPDSAEALEGMARCSQAMGGTVRAIDELRAAVETGNAGPSAWNSLGWSLATKETPTEAELHEAHWAAQRAIALAPRAPCWDTLAEILFRKGDLPGALAASRESIRLDPDRSTYRERMAKLCAEMESRTRTNSGFPALDAWSEVGAGPPESVEEDTNFDLEVLDSASEVIAFDEDDVDQNAASAMGPAIAEGDSGEFSDDEELVEMRGDWDFASPTSAPPPAMSAPPRFAGPNPLSGLFGRILGPIRQMVAPPKALTVTDRVQFSMTAPSTLEPGGSYAVDVWAYLEARRAEVMALAQESQGTDEIRVKTKGEVIVARGVVVTVRLTIPTLIVADPEDVIDWDGRIGNVTFPVSVPIEARVGPHAGTATFHVEDLKIAKLHFVLDVGRGDSPVAPLAAREVRSKCAFASYASEDREEVLGRLQGIMKVLPDLDLFLDVASLRSGERWEDRLHQEIARRDTLYLFWSDAASRSIWVEREWRTALALRGIAGIDPVPLVSPEDVPPPTELAQHLHFNDWLLAFMRVNRGARPGTHHASSPVD